MSEVRLTELDDVVTDLAYPIDRAAAAEALSEFTLRYDEGGEPLADVVARSDEETFLTPEDLETEIYTNADPEGGGDPDGSDG